MLAKITKEALVVFLLAVVGACLMWQWTGGPATRAEPCHAKLLDKGYICYQDALKLPEVVWVDARTRSLWYKNGYPGSVFLTDHPSEDWEELVGEGFEQLSSAQYVVVYCSTQGCGSSKPVAHSLIEMGLFSEDQVFLLAGGWKALFANKK